MYTADACAISGGLYSDSMHSVHVGGRKFDAMTSTSNPDCLLMDMRKETAG